MLERASAGDHRRPATVRSLPVASTSLPAHPTSSRASRIFVAEQLRGWDLDDAVEDASLLVSEVVTAAILRVRSPIDLVVRKAKTAVRVEVLEDGRGARRSAGPDIEAPGISLVEAIATRWGVERTGAGQTVWFEIAL